jgi:hypothetical protein
MGYRDDFYAKENIIGYTGDLTNKPGEVTVYFADAGGRNPRTVTVEGRQKVLISFGHITQVHGTKGNVGREEVHVAFSYHIFNARGSDGLEHAEECVYGHLDALYSRNRLPGVRYRHERTGAIDYNSRSFHTSRNRFESVTAGNRDLLAQVIARHQAIKGRYTT